MNRIIFSALTALSLAACGGNEPAPTTPANTETTNATSATATAATTATTTTTTPATGAAATTPTTATTPATAGTTATTTTTATSTTTTAAMGSCVLTCEGTTKCVDNVAKAECEDSDATKRNKLFSGVPRCKHTVAFSADKCKK